MERAPRRADLRRTGGRAVAALLAAWLSGCAEAHPGAIAEGRATCGVEYSTAGTAYRIPDIEEAWFLRRVATCAQPVFWNSFDITRAGQPLYIAAITPKLKRFQDKLSFNAILYGPGVGASLPGVSEIPADLPAGVTVEESLGLSAGYLKPPSDLGSCAFVKTNNVMKNFAALIEGRCTEELYLEADYKDALQADTTGFSWWLYSFNHTAAQPGTYYVQSWLTDPETGAVAQGKYELTLGPWTWYGYADDNTQKAAQAQGTDCTCAVNALAYKEDPLLRLGQVPKALFIEELPGGSCAGSAPPASACVTQSRLAALSKDSSVEWAGAFDLKQGRTYQWTFRSYRYCCGKSAATQVCRDAFPDPGIDVFVTYLSTLFGGEASGALEGASSTADDALKAVGINTREVYQGETLTINAAGSTMGAGARAEHIAFSRPANATSTSVMLKPSSDGLVAIFSQVCLPALLFLFFSLSPLFSLLSLSLARSLSSLSLSLSLSVSPSLSLPLSPPLSAKRNSVYR